MTRDEKIARAGELRAQGWAYKRIAADLGIAYNTAYRWLNPDYAELQRLISRDWKARHSQARSAVDMRRSRDVRCVYCDVITGALDDADNPCCLACQRAQDEPCGERCTRCHEGVLTHAGDGLCGFCREELYLRQVAA